MVNRAYLKSGIKVNEYTIIDVISTSGGTSILYLVLSRLDNEYVLKEFDPGGYCSRDEYGNVIPPDDPEDRSIFDAARDNFISEAELLRKLNGIGTAPRFIESFEANGTVYYVMEHLHGITLKDYLENKKRAGENRLRINEALGIIKYVCYALQELHSYKVLHRDIGPDNVFLCDDGRVRLIDFGNARFQVKGRSRIVDWAKKSYSPIEMFNGNYRQDTWTDIYATAATLYRMLTGIVPQSAEARVSGDALVSPQECGVKISDRANDAIMKALSVYPDDRYSDITEFWHDVREISAAYRGVLMGLDGEYKGRRIELYTGRPLTLGRGDACDIRFGIDTPGVSRMHGKLMWGEDGYAYYIDTGSTYGTRTLGGDLLESDIPYKLGEGEGVILGDDQVFVVIREEMP